MRRVPVFLCLAATLVLTIALVNEAGARRCNRGRSAKCCCSAPRPSSDIQEKQLRQPRGMNWLCYVVRLYTIQPNQHLYYCDYYEINCSTEPQAAYAIGGDSLGENPNEDCNDLECHADQGFAPLAASEDIPRINHYCPKVFDGGKPVAHDYSPQWAGSGAVKVIGNPVFKSLKLTQEGRTYKVKIFKVRLVETNKIIFLALETTDFPQDETPDTIEYGEGTVKRCKGHHAYSLKYDNKPTLFLTDVGG